MSVEFIIAPPASGKTYICIQRLQAVLRQTPPGYARVVLPDRTQVQYFRLRLAQAGGALGAQIGTFGGLFNEILSRAGIDMPVAPEPLQHRLIRSAVETLYANGEIVHFATLRQMPGFTLLVCERIAELKRSLVSPEDFLKLAAGIDGRELIELGKIYLQYYKTLAGLGWSDPEGLGWLAVDALERNPRLMSDLPLMVVDGFDSFNLAQQRALKFLGERLGHLLVTLPGTPEQERSVQRRFALTLESLKADMQLEMRTLLEAPRLSPTLAHLERSIFETGVEKIECQDDLCMLEVRSPEHEAREALRWLKARYVRHGLPLSQCAVIVPDMALYRPLLRSAAVEFGMPLRFGMGESMTSTPLVAALLDLLQLPERNYPLRPLLDTMRSPFFNLSPLGLQPQLAKVFELISRYAQVIEGIEQWDDAFKALSALDENAQYVDITDETIQDDDGAVPCLPRGEAVNALRAGLHGLSGRLSPPQSKLSIEEWVRWLEDLLQDVQFFELQRSKDEETILLELRQVLRALVLSESVAREHHTNYLGFLAELGGAIESTSYQAKADITQPAIQVLSVSEARGLRFSAVALLGLSEGTFPQVERPDPILSEEVRTRLGMEPRQGREQGGLFYQLLTRADDRLLITRSYLAEDGEVWEASPYWTAVNSLLRDQTNHRRPDDPRPLADAASRGELLFLAVRRAVVAEHGLPKDYEAGLLPRWEHLRHARDVLSARRARSPEGPFEGLTESARQSLAARFNKGYGWSASQLESYGLCPFKFFTERVLGLEAVEPPKPGFDLAQRGSIAHAVLEKAYHQAADPSDPESVLEALPTAASGVFINAPQVYGFRPSMLWEVQKEEILVSMEDNIRTIAAYEGGWVPAEFEQAYGLQDAPSLEMDAGGEMVSLHGIIDRVDRNGDGKLRVIDYKSGGNMSKNDLAEGRRLQLPLYAMAAWRALSLGEVVEGFYWILSTCQPSSLKLSSFKFEDKSGVGAAIEVLRSHIARVLQGARGGEFPPLTPKDGCPSYCPAAAWCWRYKGAAW